LLTALLVFRLARKNWLWYLLLAILIIIATWAAWIASQSIPISLLTMFVAVAIAWLLTLGRNRRSRAAPR
jgi:MFS superfamily sulfate permease-like transporter